MGYTTVFEGRFRLDKPLKPEHLAYLNAFSGQRHMEWRVDAIETLPDPIREAVGLPLGKEGEYHVAATPWNESFVIDTNNPTRGLPSLYCQWIPSDDGEWIEWDGEGKFYFYEDWLAYLLTHFLEPWGYVLNGEVSWQGEDQEDYGIIAMKDNWMDVRYRVRKEIG